MQLSWPSTNAEHGGMRQKGTGHSTGNMLSWNSGGASHNSLIYSMPDTSREAAGDALDYPVLGHCMTCGCQCPMGSSCYFSNGTVLPAHRRRVLHAWHARAGASCQNRSRQTDLLQKAAGRMHKRCLPHCWLTELLACHHMHNGRESQQHQGKGGHDSARKILA